ncbi:hypothetical protein BS47DRAFT_1292561 [Hydnum rufescens UP504]|uniref:Uncharacterized protein n=1 Tax=Hydnum rufescens UP504 TaxID=1448309 RepID=A0A9P6DWE6_9AGAM|nr:hypothetical protein BS47DRAFT_1292561 [Hydnum rufescens UP504]
MGLSPVGNAVPVDILVLGAGWYSQYLIPLIQSDPTLSFAATTRNGRVVAGYTTIKFQVSDDEGTDWAGLPKARTVVLSFPTVVPGAIAKYIRAYESAHGAGTTRWIQLGSIGAFDTVVSSVGECHKTPVTTMTSIPRPSNPRAESEFDLLALSSPTSPYQTQTTVLNLAGLWGGTRIPRNWVSRVAPTKDALGKKGSVHFIHGEDVARAIIAVHRRFSPGQRWILTDERVYDWWDLASAWGSGARAIFVLPRSGPLLPGKHFSSRDFWATYEIHPWHARLDGI